jgi:hypothetical protein
MYPTVPFTKERSTPRSGQKEEAAKLRDELAKSAPAGWMVESMNDQLARLEGLLAKAG